MTFSLLYLFNKCLYAKYDTVPESKGDYKLIRENNTLFLLLQGSNQQEDWKHNFDFPARPYHDMPRKWKAHRGFVKVWKSIIPYIKEAIEDPIINQIITIGYSHGAALACLAQEYIWFNRKDIRNNCYSFAFEPPRVFCGWRIPEELKERWANLYIFRNGKDIITHLPPAIFGFKHVGNMVKIGQKRDNIQNVSYIPKWFPKCVKEHGDPNIQNSLREYEKDLSQTNPKLFEVLINIFDF